MRSETLGFAWHQTWPWVFHLPTPCLCTSILCFPCTHRCVWMSSSFTCKITSIYIDFKRARMYPDWPDTCLMPFCFLIRPDLFYFIIIIIIFFCLNVIVTGPRHCWLRSFSEVLSFEDWRNEGKNKNNGVSLPHRPFSHWWWKKNGATDAFHRGGLQTPPRWNVSFALLCRCRSLFAISAFMSIFTLLTPAGFSLLQTLPWRGCGSPHYTEIRLLL